MKAIYMGFIVFFLVVLSGEDAASVSPASLPTLVAPAATGAVIQFSSRRLSAEEWASLNTSSSILLHWARKSLSARDFNGAAVYSNRVIDLYSVRADEMQARLTAVPSGHPHQIFQYWALNDVATALFILGESYRGSGREQESLKIYQKIIDQYSYAQSWDSRGRFWSVALAARDRLDMAAKMREADFGDYELNVLLHKLRADDDRGRLEQNASFPRVGIAFNPWIKL